MVVQSGESAELRYGTIAQRKESFMMNWIALGSTDCSGKLNLGVEAHGEVRLGTSAPCLVIGRNSFESHTTSPF